MINKILLLSEKRDIADMAFSKILSVGAQYFCGFQTIKIEKDGLLIGYDLVTLSGERVRLAGVDLLSDVSFNKYGLNRKAVEGLACQSFLVRNKISLLKDPGPMFFKFESFEKKFQLALSSDQPLVVVSLGSKFLRSSFLSLDDSLCVKISAKNYVYSMNIIMENILSFLRRIQ